MKSIHILANQIILQQKWPAYYANVFMYLSILIISTAMLLE